MGFKSKNTWGTHTWVIKVTWHGVALYWGSIPGLWQGHIKVISRAKQINYWIETLFTVSCIFWLLMAILFWTFRWHWNVQITIPLNSVYSIDILWLGSLPTRIIGGTVIIRYYIENVILHKILGLFCQKLKIQDGRDGNHLGFDL